MPDKTKLRVSLTKNGFFKVADVLRRHPADEVLANADGVYPGINLHSAQVGAILTLTQNDKPLPLWDTVRGLGDDAIDAMVILAIIFSHHLLIDAFADATEDESFRLEKDRLTGKVYTNFLYSMMTAGFSPRLSPGSNSFTYDLSPIFALPIAAVAKNLLKSKLRVTGWRGANGTTSDDDFYRQAFAFRFHRTLGLSQEQFRTWLSGGEVIQDPTLPEEIRVADNFFEGATRKVSVNVYERDPSARAACLDHYEYICLVCDFNFEEAYGDIGQGYIHVHHLKPIASIGRRYKVNPIQDLRPVCPNCHAIIHKKNPPYTIDEVKEMMRRARNQQ